MGLQWYSVIYLTKQCIRKLRMSHAQAIIIYATTIYMYVHEVYVRMYVYALVYICVHVCMRRCMCVCICMHVAYWFEISSADEEVLSSVLNRYLLFLEQ